MNVKNNGWMKWFAGIAFAIIMALAGVAWNSTVDSLKDRIEKLESDTTSEDLEVCVNEMKIEQALIKRDVKDLKEDMAYLKKGVEVLMQYQGVPESRRPAMPIDTINGENQ